MQPTRPSGRRPREAEGQGMGGVPGLNRGHRGGQGERAMTLLTEVGEQPLRLCAGARTDGHL